MQFRNFLEQIYDCDVASVQIWSFFDVRFFGKNQPFQRKSLHFMNEHKIGHVLRKQCSKVIKNVIKKVFRQIQVILNVIKIGFGIQILTLKSMTFLVWVPHNNQNLLFLSKYHTPIALIIKQRFNFHFIFAQGFIHQRFQFAFFKNMIKSVKSLLVRFVFPRH